MLREIICGGRKFIEVDLKIVQGHNTDSLAWTFSPEFTDGEKVWGMEQTGKELPAKTIVMVDKQVTDSGTLYDRIAQCNDYPETVGLYLYASGLQIYTRE